MHDACRSRAYCAVSEALSNSQVTVTAVGARPAPRLLVDEPERQPHYGPHRQRER